MIENLDEELKRTDTEAIIIIGNSTLGNPSLAYVCGVNITRGGIYFKKVDNDPVLLVGDLDFNSAQKGIVKNVKPYSHYNYSQLITTHGAEEARTLLYEKILKELDIRKKITICGMIEAGQAIDISKRLETRGFEIVADPDIVERVRRTKNPRELDLINNVAKKTESVVKDILDVLRNCSIIEENLFYNQEPLTVKVVKSLINQLLAKNNLIASSDTIFAPESDGADPHNRGTPERKIKKGVPIVFDIFPQDIESGYCFDTTRTIVIGKTSPEIKRMYDDVVTAQQSALDQITEGASGRKISSTVCEILEKRNHKTPLFYMKQNGLPMTEGMIHGLGHGVGLTIGEPPYLSLVTEYQLKEGDVVTVEPGVYYPNKWGIRVEDTVAVLKQGLRNFSTLNKELEL